MKNIREFDDFEGQDGYLIVDGLTEDVSGGKKKLSDIVSEQVQADWEQDDNTEPSFIQNKPIIPTAPSWTSIGDGSGAIRLNDGYIRLNFDENSLTDDDDDTLAVKVPVPSPNDAEAPANDGDVLTYDEEDGIVWKTPLLIHDWDSKNFINRLDIGGTGGFVLEGDIVKIKCKERRGLELDISDDGIGISVSNANDGDVLTYNGDTDEIVWQTPQGGGLALPDVQELIGKNGSDGPTTYENVLELAVEITVDEDNNITNVSSPRWRIDKEHGSGAYYYFN